MNDAAIVLTILGALAIVLLAVAEPASGALVRSRARRLPMRLAPRMEEEWLGELNAIASRPGKLAFAIALTLTRRRAFAAPGEDSMTEIHDRPARGLAGFNGRKTLLILPTLIFAIAAYGASFLVPVRYASESLILVEPREVPASLVVDLIADSTEKQMKSLEQQVMSRTSLVSILSEFPLYKTRSKDMDQMLDELRKDIAVLFPPSPEGANPTYFRVRYVGPDPYLAQKVTSQLTRIFLQRNASMREDRLAGTRDFLRRQLEKLAENLTAKGDELARERAKHGPDASRILALDYDLLTSTYRTLFDKLEDVQMAVSLESAQKAGRFRVQDPANLGTPILPNRLAITGLGAVVGLLLGGTALVGLDRRQRRTLAATSAEG